MNSFRFKLVRPLALAIFIALVSTQSSFCNSYPLINIDPSTQVPSEYWGFDEGHGNGMIGWTFHLNQPITITQVGWYDEEHDGLSRDFQVGLWQDLSGSYFEPGSSPTQLLGDPDFGITIPAGTAASLNGVWRVIDLPSALNLVPGDYEIGGLDTATTPDVIKYVLGGPSNPQVTIRQFFYPYWLTQPGFRVTDNMQFYLADGLELGPMLFSNVPEPSTLTLSGLSVVAVLLFRRWRQN